MLEKSGMIRWRFEIKMVSHSFKSFKLIPIKECAHASGFIGQPARYLQSLSACVFCRSQYLQHIYHFDRSMMIHCMTTVAIRCIIKVYFFHFFLFHSISTSSRCHEPFMFMPCASIAWKNVL